MEPRNLHFSLALLIHGLLLKKHRDSAHDPLNTKPGTLQVLNTY